MPNYILSRTSPPAHIYERKINLGYGIKVDTSDAPSAAEPNKGNKMNATKDLDMVRQEGNPNDDQRGNPDAVGTPQVQGDDRDAADIEAKKAKEAKEFIDDDGVRYD